MTDPTAAAGRKKTSTVRRLTETAMMLAIGTVLSLFTVQGPWALGGGITVCSMLPLVFLAWRYGSRRGALAGLAYGLLQMLLGLENVQYASTALMAAGIIVLDYLLAFAAVGLAGLFRGRMKRGAAALAAGVALALSLRFVCHFASGVWIWAALWPNALGWAPWLWSLAYNASYMLPELFLTAAAALLLYRPLEAYWRGEDLK